MKNSHRYCLIFCLAFALFLPPLFSSAAVEPTGPQCDPKIIPPSGATSTVACTYCANRGTPLHLKWDLKGEFKEPVCSLHCTVQGESGHECYHWPINDLVSPPINLLVDKDDKPKTDLKPKDDVYLKNPSTASNIVYTVSCSEKSDATKYKYSAPVKVGSDCATSIVGGSCEVPFSKIVSDLKGNQVAHITEENFKSWALAANDYAGYYKNVAGAQIKPDPLASGNRFDLEGAFDENQTCSSLVGANVGSISTFSGFDKKNLEILKDSVSKGYPLEIGYSILIASKDNILIDPSSPNIETGGHSVIAYDYNDLGDFNMVIFGKKSAVKKFQIKIWNSNIPGKATLDCLVGKNGDPPVQTICTNSSSDVGDTLSNIKAGISYLEKSLSNLTSGSDDYKETLKAIEILKNNPGDFYILQYKKDPNRISDNWGHAEQSLIATREQACGTTPTLNLCKKTPKQVIENDLPNISNSEGAVDNPMGYCFGYSDMVLRIAYLGDFVGYDYHPGDGKMVCDGNNSGNCACDTNHYPIPAKSKTTLANPTSWLANIWSAWYNIFN